MANSTEPVTFTVRLVQQIDDVQTKIKDKAVVMSAGVFCKDDPMPNEFQLLARFGAEREGHLSVRYIPRGRDITIKHNQLSISDEEGSRLASWKSEQNSLCKKGNEFGWREVMPLNNIRGSQIIILCSVKYHSSATQLQINKTRLHRDFLNIFESTDFADVKFLVKGEEIPAHKCVLASRSVYFKNMFQAGMQESASNQVEVTDVEPATFKALLQFVYGGNLKETQFEPLTQLIAAADKYGLDELKDICGSAISANLKVDDVIEALRTADMYNCPSLLGNAKALFKARTEAVKENREKWSALTERPSLLLELMEHVTE